MAEDPTTTTSVFTRTRPPDDTVFYSIYPDSSLTTHTTTESLCTLHSLHLQILDFLKPYTSTYIWQHEPFSLSVSTSPIPHLHGHLRFGDNLDDEWFTVFLLHQISLQFPLLSISVSDSDGDFLLIESAFHLPSWLSPSTSLHRVFLRRGRIHIIPRSRLPHPNLIDSLKFLIDHEKECLSSEGVQKAVMNRVLEFPEKARRNMHRVRVRVPVSVARVLKMEPSMISLAVEGFYDRDIDSMKFAAKMERFGGGSEEEMVTVVVTMSRAMYAQLRQQKFHAPKCYKMVGSGGGDVEGFLEAELGMKIACGFEMMYQMRKRKGEEGKESNWEKYVESLEKTGYFEGLLPGSKEYNRLLENAKEYYRNSESFSRTREMLSAPVKRIDELLALPYSVEEFKNQEVPPSDDDSWLYDGEDELNNVLQERQKEIDIYNEKKKQKSKEMKDAGPSSSNDFDLGNMAKSMKAFVDKVSSYKGAEVPENRDMKDVDLDVDRFMKDMESVLKCRVPEENASDFDSEEASSSDMDFDESADGSDIGEPYEDNNDKEHSFMHAYSDVLNKELKDSSLTKSFVRADNQSSKEGTSKSIEDMDEDFTPVDVDFNLVKSLLDSFSSQEGQPGPASNLLGLMGLPLPNDARKGK